MRKLSTSTQARTLLRSSLLFLFFLGIALSSYAQWQPAVSNTTDLLNKVSYGGGQWVAVGANGAVVTSPDGIIWTPRVSNTTALLRDVYYDNGLYVAVGGTGSTNAIITSSDGISWTPRDSPSISDFGATLYGISYTGGKWITNTHYSNQVLTSTDGVNWTIQSLSVVINNQTYDLRYVDLRCGNGQWVASAGTGIYVSSDNGLTWVVTISQTRGTFFYVSFSNGRFIASGQYGYVVNSSTGTNWQSGTTAYEGVDRIGYGDGVYLGFTLQLMVSSRGGGGYWQNMYKPGFLSAAYHDQRWVIVGGEGIIQYNSQAALPVSLVNFQGTGEKDAARLSWETAWEKGASHFLVERSSDAKSFEAVGRVEANNTTTSNQRYSFLDNNLTAGLWYYRLKQVDLNATFSYTPIVAVRVGSDPLDALTLSPNPGPGPLRLEYKAGLQSVRVSSLTGVLIKQQVFDQPANQWTWDDSGQPAGVYLIQIQMQDGATRTLRWVKR